MLYKYKSDYAKIAMGLLSFIPDLKNYNNLQNELCWYQAKPNRCLLLYKNRYGDFIGIVGIEQKDEFILIRHIAVTPTKRNGKAVYDILDEVWQRYPDKKILGSLDIATLITKWERKKDDRK